ncbi:Uncharacterised protein [Streptococcus pneumoniae]|nr:Uncharacterised protein [Streptococcus pneumoniae]
MGKIIGITGGIASPFGLIPMPLGKMEACRIFIRSMIRLVKNVYAVVPSLRKFN